MRTNPASYVPHARPRRFPWGAGLLAVVLLAALVAAAALAVTVTPADAGSRGKEPLSARMARETPDFEWNWKISRGRTIEIKGINGEIVAEPSRDDEVHVYAIKSAKKSDPSEVTIEVMEHKGGVTICALYPSVAGHEPNECSIGDRWSSHTRDNDVVVDFLVRVPDGVRFVARTVNGGVRAERLDGPVEAYTVNGSVRVSTEDIARAETVNGSIDAALGTLWDDEIEFRTVNGTITVDLPQRLDANIEAETMNGEIRSDFPITVTGKFSKRKLSGTVGSGGRLLEMSTVNGGIELKKAAR